jgi:hypothetical protein
MHDTFLTILSKFLLFFIFIIFLYIELGASTTTCGGVSSSQCPSGSSCNTTTGGINIVFCQKISTKEGIKYVRSTLVVIALQMRIVSTVSLV